MGLVPATVGTIDLEDPPLGPEGSVVGHLYPIRLIDCPSFGVTLPNNFHCRRGEREINTICPSLYSYPMLKDGSGTEIMGNILFALPSLVVTQELFFLSPHI